MKVKELIALLNTLDQEKEIKAVWASGYEYEEETSTEISILPYKETATHLNGGGFYYSVEDNNFADTEKDFYLIQGK